MPSAAIIPRRSSGVVSTRHRMARPPFAATFSACGAVKQILPDAAPGPAGRPVVSVLAFATAAGSKTATSSEEIESAGILRSAVFWSISFSLTSSTAIRTAARPVRLPLRVCSIQSLPSSTVNSKSCMSLKCFSSFFRTASRSACALGISFFSSAIALGVRMPATTSSP